GGIRTAVKSLALENLAEKIEQLGSLDAVADPLQRAVTALIPAGSKSKDALSGTWFGHPLHPPLTDLVIGPWTSALFLDLVGGDRAEEGADFLVGVGVLAAVPTALSGLSDWADVRGGTRRVGTLHAIGNTTALTLHVLSWFARRGGNRPRALLLSGLGVSAATLSAWLGGHLSFRRGVGVNETAFDSAPNDWTEVMHEHELDEGALVGVHPANTPALLARRGDH